MVLSATYFSAHGLIDVAAEMIGRAYAQNSLPMAWSTE